jgi:hypothetical protein
MHRAILMVCFCLLVSTPRSAAEGVCDAALVKSTYKSFTSEHLDLRIATLVTEREYNEIKHDEGANAVIYGVPVGVNYDDFEKRLKEKLSTYSKSLTHDQIVNILWTGLDAQAGSLYKDCLNSQVFVSRGLHMAAISATSTEVSLLVSWNPTGNDPAKVAPKWTWRSKGAEALPRELTQGLTTVIVPRPTQVHTLVVNYPGFTSSVVIEPLAELPPLPKIVEKVATNTTCQSPEQPSGRCGDYSGWYELCSDPQPVGWEAVSDNFQLVGNRSCTSGWAECRRSVNTPTRICWQFRMQGHSEECGHSGNTGIQYSKGILAVTWLHPKP